MPRMRIRGRLRSSTPVRAVLLSLLIFGTPFLFQDQSLAQSSEPSGQWLKVFADVHEFGSPRFIGQWAEKYMAADAIMFTYHIDGFSAREISNPSFEKNDTWTGLGHNEYINVSSSTMRAHTGNRSLMTYVNNLSEETIHAFAEQELERHHVVLSKFFNFSLYVEEFPNIRPGREAQILIALSVARTDGLASRIIFHYTDEELPVGVPSAENETDLLHFKLPIPETHRWLTFTYNINRAIEQTWANSSSPIYTGFASEDYHVYNVMLSVAASGHTDPVKVFFDDVRLGFESEEKVLAYLRESASKAGIPTIFGEELMPTPTEGSTGINVFGLDTFYNNTLYTEEEWISKAREPPYNGRFVSREFPHGAGKPWSYDDFDPRKVDEMIAWGFDGIGPICKADMMLWDSILTKYPDKKYLAIMQLDAHYLNELNGTSHVFRGNNYIQVFAKECSAKGILDAIQSRHFYNVYGRFTFDKPPLPINLTFSAYEQGEFVGMMGDEIYPTGEVELKINVSSATEIGTVELISNNRPIMVWEPEGKTFEATYTTWIDGYIRLQVNAENGNVAFTLPIWVKPKATRWYKVYMDVHDMVIGSPKYISNWTRRYMAADALFSTSHQTNFYAGEMLNNGFETNSSWIGLGYNKYVNVSSSKVRAHSGDRSLMILMDNFFDERLAASVYQDSPFHRLAFPVVLNFSVFVETTPEGLQDGSMVYVKFRLVRSDGILCDFFFYYTREGVPLVGDSTNTTSCNVFFLPLNMETWLTFSYNLTKSILQTWANTSSPYYSGFGIDDFRSYRLEIGAMALPYTRPFRVFFDDISIGIQTQQQIFDWMKRSISAAVYPYIFGLDLAPATGIDLYGLDTLFYPPIFGSDPRIWISRARYPPYNAKFVIREFPHGGQLPWTFDEFNPEFVDSTVEMGFDGIGPICKADMMLWDSILTKYPDKKFLAIMELDSTYLADFNNTDSEHRGNNYIMVLPEHYTSEGLIDAIQSRHFYNVYGRFTFDKPPLPINLTFSAYEQGEFVGMMGDEIYPTGEVELKINASSATEISTVELISNNKTIRVWEPEGKTFEANYTTLIDGYIRLQVNAENGNVAFTMPIWIKPEDTPAISSAAKQLVSVKWNSSQRLLELVADVLEEEAVFIINSPGLTATKVIGNGQPLSEWEYDPQTNTTRIMLSSGTWNVQVQFEIRPVTPPIEPHVRVYIPLNYIFAAVVAVAFATFLLGANKTKYVQRKQSE